MGTSEREPHQRSILCIFGMKSGKNGPTFRVRLPKPTTYRHIQIYTEIYSIIQAILTIRSIQVIRTIRIIQAILIIRSIQNILVIRAIQIYTCIFHSILVY